VPIAVLWATVVGSLFVAGVTAGLTIWLLVASGGTSGYENLITVTVVTFAASFAVALAAAKALRQALVVSVVVTAMVVGGGFAALYAIYANLCGGSSDC
jgi:hypothetical protein